MTTEFRQAIIAGVERLTAWADLLDRINVFPVADGDTGRNLVVSLAPLRRPERDRQKMGHELLLSARGNSGNIASSFFQCFIRSDSLQTLPEVVRLGRDHAWRAVSDPRPGTMLTFLDALAEKIAHTDPLTDAGQAAALLQHLEAVVRNTRDQQPKLQKAGVVDAGALGLFLFFEGFLQFLSGNVMQLRPITETFRDKLHVSKSYDEGLIDDGTEEGYCIDTVLQSKADDKDAQTLIAALGESAVVMRSDAFLKIHFHTGDREGARRKLDGIGQVVGWAEDDLHRQTADFNSATNASREGGVHIMTDAAGSLTREDARDLGITLLDSYITVGDRSLPETYIRPEELYNAMVAGVSVTTAQASLFERRQIYDAVLSSHERILYLCVGSVFTGNYRDAVDWKQEHDREDRFVVVDTGAASGRLAVIVLAVAAYAKKVSDAGKVADFARQVINICEEYVFLDRLEYLAAGGRLSKTGAFIGDMLRMKPIISPMAEGARKIGVVHNREEQRRYAEDALARSLSPDEKALIMLEYSNNQPWVEAFGRDVAVLYRSARIRIHPLSLTSGAHMGPETWAVAFLPDMGVS
jgi:uncharacterized protein